ncbi:hypothetical protein N2152v2_002287 [Parachlorella kessleri]
MGRKQFYAVVRGKQPGLYRSWAECSSQVKSYPGNLFKGFASEAEAVQYLANNNVMVTTSPGKGAAFAAAQPPGAASQREESLAQEFDGASKRNPGPAGFGAVLYDDATNTEVARLCQYMGHMHTNNQAEYAGLIAGLQAALELGFTHIKVLGDSTLIIKQVLGEYQVKNTGLQPYHKVAVELSRQFKNFEARQVPRDQNKVADALSNEAIANYRSGKNPHIWTLAGMRKRAAAEAVAEEEVDGVFEAGKSSMSGATAAAEAAAAKEAGAPALCPAEMAAAESLRATFLAPAGDTAAEQVAAAAARGAAVQGAAGAAGGAPSSDLPPPVAQSPELAEGGGDRRKRRRKSSKEGAAVT